MKEIENFDNWVCRASALGKIISKSGKMTDGVKTFLNEVFIGEIYGVRKEAYGKALEKGIACEEDGFKLMNDALYPDKFIAKIKEPAQNEWIKGTADTIVDGIVYDIKNAYDLFTFGKAELSWEYEWQLKAYMMLYGCEASRLFYCINDMPEYMVAEEQRKMFYTQRKWISMDDPDYLKACEELEQAHKYGWMPLEERFKIWPVALFESDIETIIESVKAARAYLNQLLEQHKLRIEYNLNLMSHEHIGLVK